MSDFRRATGLAAEAARKARSLGAQLLYARAISRQSGILATAGDTHWEPLSQEARALCSQYGDQGCVASVLRRIGNTRLAYSDLDGAERNYRQALKIARDIGSAEEEAKILNGMAMLQLLRGDLAATVRIQGQQIALSRATQNRDGEQMSLDDLAQALLEQGKLEEARQAEQTAIRIAREIGKQHAKVGELLVLADICTRAGDLAAARAASEEPQPPAVRTVPSIHVAALEQEARMFLIGGDLASAQRALQEAELVRKTWPDSDGTGHQVAARVALAADKPAEAAICAREAIKIAADHRLPQQQARAEALLARALLADGENDAARAAVQQAMVGIEHSQYRLIRLEVAVTQARVMESEDQFPPLIAEAHALHDYELEIEGRLALAQISHNRVQLAAIQKEALSRGFRYVARETAGLTGGGPVANKLADSAH
jgi:tetratricopeptide (TPR) repeat protein